MSVQIGYDQDQRLVLTGMTCDCGCDHQLPDQDIYVGTGLIERIPDMIARRRLGRCAVLVADNITYELAGRRVEAGLVAAGFDVDLCLIRREGEMEPDERSCGEVLLTMQRETEFLVSVGSGSITDTTRVAAVRTGKPFVCVSTAPSMDGYTSVVAPLLLRGVKIHRPANCPEIIICDLDILRTAPPAMVIAGVGDVLGKYIARADWQIGQLINDEPYCPLCAEIVTGAVNKLIEQAAAIKSKSEQGIRTLIEALLLAGVTIMIVGHTRAVASVEHNIVHYWDMMNLLRGRRQPSHGLAVGVATLLVWPLYLRFVADDLSRLDLSAIERRRRSHEQRAAWLLEAYGEEAATTIMRENPADFLTWDEQKRRIERAQTRLGEIQAVIRQLPPFETIMQVMRELGAPMTAAELGIDRKTLNWSMHAAKDYRTRYTLLKTLDECGLLDEYLRDYPLSEK
jgi:glycerol-1-phosphate dehydrogenase [NAD(P)+]